jgi:FkbM family methyltransferase
MMMVLSQPVPIVPSSSTEEGDTASIIGQVKPAAAAAAVEKAAPALLDTTRTQQHVRDNKRNYGNKADFQASQRLFGFVKELGLDRKESVVLVGGTNDGQSSMKVLTMCPSVTLIGFEIQKDHFRTATSNLEKYAHASVVNAGWDEVQAENKPIGGKGTTGGLFDPKGQRKWKQHGETATTVVMADWARENGVDQTLFVIIDTEGYEPKVIRGMKLHEKENQKRFPTFQYELGGTWAENDNRHGHDQWDQQATAQHLIDQGYLLFLIGRDHWLALNAEFLSLTTDSNPATDNEGYGRFVQGNMLAMHPEFTPTALVQKILQFSKTIKHD